MSESLRAVWFQLIDIHGNPYRRTGANAVSVSPTTTIDPDTTARVANFSPSAKNDCSWRTAQHNEILLSPFYYLAFVDIYKRESPVSLKNLDDEFRLYHLGRPHWGAYIGDDDTDVYDTFLFTSLKRMKTHFLL